jgi:hypothetical protein
MIKLVEGKIAWQLDSMNFSLTLYRTSQFMLSLLLAFRLVSCSNYTLPQALQQQFRDTACSFAQQQIQLPDRLHSWSHVSCVRPSPTDPICMWV